jgi:hypothetical protein
MLSLFASRLRGWVCAAAVALLLSPGLAPAQTAPKDKADKDKADKPAADKGERPAATKENSILPADGSDKLTQRMSDKTFRDTSQKLLRGEIEAAKDNQDAIDVMAQMYTYRLTWPDTAKPDGVHKLLKELESDLDQAVKNRPKTQAFLSELAKKVGPYAREVLQNREPLPRVNAVAVLERLARIGQEEVADVLADVVKDPEQNDGARYWAFVALKELYAYGNQVPPVPMKNKQAEEKGILALIEFLERPSGVSPGSPPEEVEGARMLRREAIRALAQTRYPAVAQNGELKGRTAQVLLRVARKDGLNPEPRVDEQVEAAIGIARLQSKLYEDYQPDYAAYHVGFVVVDFANAYNGVAQKNEERGWKYYAARLNEALAYLKADVSKNVKDKQVVQYVSDVQGKCSEQLRAIENKVQEARPADFEDWLGKNPPPHDQAYKGVDDSKITPGGAAEKDEKKDEKDKKDEKKDDKKDDKDKKDEKDKDKKEGKKEDKK